MVKISWTGAIQDNNNLGTFFVKKYDDGVDYDGYDDDDNDMMVMVMVTVMIMVMMMMLVMVTR